MDSPGSLPPASPDDPRPLDAGPDDARPEGTLPSAPPESTPHDGQLPAASQSRQLDEAPQPEASPTEPLPPSTTRRERIRHATASDGLAALPNGFADDDWEVALSENPFEVLYLDSDQHARITPEMVRRHHRLIRAFWDSRMALLSGPGARQVARKYGGVHASADVVRAHVSATDRAFKRLSAEGGIAAAAKAMDARRVALGRERLQPFLEGALLDGELSTVVASSLFEKGRVAGLREEETAEALLNALLQADFTPYGDPEGETEADRIRSVTWVTAAKRARLDEERSAVRRAMVIPLELAHGTIQTLPDLIEYVDTWRDEAERLLYRGTLGRWIGANLGKPRLEDESEAVSLQYADRPSAGLELFARVLLREIGEDAHPHIRAEPERVDLGEIPVGARTVESIRIAREGPRRAWGDIELVGDVLGLHAPDRFAVLQDEIEIELATLHVPPGDYQGEIVIHPEGGEAVRVPVSYTVAKLEVAVNPQSIDWGVLPYNHERKAHVTLRSLTPGGRLIGTARLAPEHEGLTLNGAIDGERNAFQLTLNTASFRAGELYMGSIHAETNSGVFSVPVRFSIELAWKRVAAWAAGYAILFASAFGAGRWLLADWIPGYIDWSPLPPGRADAAGLASLLFIGFVALMAVVRWSYMRVSPPTRDKASEDKASNSVSSSKQPA
ncbi:MAG: hypothetical protein AAF170_04395 [Bacteroidota bacterium]